jgi:fermentation-respiration switch protein FrsA (DUF1100 family)
LHPTTTVHTILAQTALALVALPGDGAVDAADFVVWRDSFGQTGTVLRAYGNGNNQIDAADFDFWRAHFGQAAGSNASSVFPPSAFTLGFRRAGTRVDRARWVGDCFDGLSLTAT